MSKSTKNSMIHIEDLPVPEQELTPEMAQAVIGGAPVIVRRFPCAYGTHDQITLMSHWDYKVDEVVEPPQPGGGPRRGRGILT
jgi:hypothetical protein